jgi:hypothetical protein
MKPVALLALTLSVGCGLQLTDPCKDVVGACLTVQLDPSSGVSQIDALKLNVAPYGEQQTQFSDGQPRQLPVAVAIVLSQLSNDVTVDVIATGMLHGTAVGEGRKQQTLTKNQHATIHIQLLATSEADMAAAPNGAPDMISDVEPPDMAPVVPGIRLVSPMSLAMLMQPQPTLRWVLPPEGGTPEVDLCADRACHHPLNIPVKISNDNSSGVPQTPLNPGCVFWRVRMTPSPGKPAVSSATWEFWVGRTSQNTSSSVNGTVLDINGDGYPDVLSQTDGTVVHLYLGNAAGLAQQSVDLTNPEGTPGSSSRFGPSTSFIGDVNGDGFADFVIQGQLSDGSARAYLYLGELRPNADDWNGPSAPKRIDYASPFYFPNVTGVGDVNHDGYSDILVGFGTYAEDSPPGGAELYLGGALPKVADWNTASPYRVDLLPPQGEHLFGYRVAGIGDVNGDGNSDFIVAGNYPAPTHIYLGESAPDGADWNGPAPAKRIDLLSPDLPISIDMDALSSVSYAGDVNGDGYSDFLISSPPSYSPPTLVIHLYLGNPAVSATDWSIHHVDLIGPEPDAYAAFGQVMSPAGDVNGDGFGDFLISAVRANKNYGAAHLYLGIATPKDTVWNGSTPQNRIDIPNPEAAAPDWFGAPVFAADANGDGWGDFMLDAGSDHNFHLYFGESIPSPQHWNGSGATGRIDMTRP